MNLLKSLAFIWLACVLTPISACQKIGETGKSSFLLTSVSQENELGEEGYKEVLKKANISKDPRMNAILVRVGRRIAAQTITKGYNWEFKLIESNQVNAWCMPGGKVAFYTGILPYLKNEAGMATVMGHEVAHATLRHSGQRISQQMVLGLGMSVAQIGVGNSEHSDTLMALLGAGATVGVMLPYGRKHESEADAVGLEYMAKAGYDPAEAVEFWKRFSKAGKGAPPEWLSTHPAGSTRVSNLQKMQKSAQRLYKKAKKKHGAGEKV